MPTLTVGPRHQLWLWVFAAAVVAIAVSLLISGQATSAGSPDGVKPVRTKLWMPTWSTQAPGVSGSDASLNLGDYCATPGIPSGPAGFGGPSSAAPYVVSTFRHGTGWMGGWSQGYKLEYWIRASARFTIDQDLGAAVTFRISTRLLALHRHRRDSGTIKATMPVVSVAYGTDVEHPGLGAEAIARIVAKSGGPAVVRVVHLACPDSTSFTVDGSVGGIATGPIELVAALADAGIGARVYT